MPSFIYPVRRDRAIRVPAESLFEAAVEAMAGFKNSVLIDAPMPPGTRLTIRVKAPEEEHAVTVAKVLACVVVVIWGIPALA
jgi:hypothetical protein